MVNLGGTWCCVSRNRRPDLDTYFCQYFLRYLIFIIYLHVYVIFIINLIITMFLSFIWTTKLFLELTTKKQVIYLNVLNEFRFDINVLDFDYYYWAWLSPQWKPKYWFIGNRVEDRKMQPLGVVRTSFSIKS